MHENLDFMCKLMKQKSAMNVESLREQRQKEEGLLKNMCQFPHILNKTQSKSPRERRF